MDLQYLEKLFQSFGNINRLRILKLLSQKKMCVCELCYILKVSQPSISKHLKKLKDAEIIASEQEGFWTNYYIEPKATFLLKIIDRWLTEDKQIQRDLQKVKSANRNKLCQTK